MEALYKVKLKQLNVSTLCILVE